MAARCTGSAGGKPSSDIHAAPGTSWVPGDPELRLSGELTALRGVQSALIQGLQRAHREDLSQAPWTPGSQPPPGRGPPSHVTDEDRGARRFSCTPQVTQLKWQAHTALSAQNLGPT